MADFMSGEEVIDVAKILLKFLDHKDWQVRHGGLLGVGVNELEGIFLIDLPRGELKQNYCPLELITASNEHHSLSIL